MTNIQAMAMKNYAGHRLSPWLGHMMVSRSEAARPLLTPGEIMQFPPDDEIVMVAATPPIRAHKARYYADARLSARLLPAPTAHATDPRRRPHDDWTNLPPVAAPGLPTASPRSAEDEEPPADAANAGIRREPELGEHEEIAPSPRAPAAEFEFDGDDTERDAAQARTQADRSMARNARAASLDPKDGLEL